MDHGKKKSTVLTLYSPNFNTSLIRRRKTMEQLSINYKSVDVTSLANTDQQWELQFRTIDNLSITDGPLLENIYKLDHIHCHWSKSNNAGSMHRIDSRSYSAEMHFVHWNTSKYESVMDARGKPDGLAILVVLLNNDVNDETFNEELSKITNFLKIIKHKNNRITLPFKLDLITLLPVDRQFMTYKGAMRTENGTLYKSINWIVMMQTVNVSQKQLDEMRQLRNYPVSTREVEGGSNYNLHLHTELCKETKPVCKPAVLYIYANPEDVRFGECVL